MLTVVFWLFVAWFVISSAFAAFDGSGNTLAKVITAVSAIAIPAYVLMTF